MVKTVDLKKFLIQLGYNGKSLDKTLEALLSLGGGGGGGGTTFTFQSPLSVDGSNNVSINLSGYVNTTTLNAVLDNYTATDLLGNEFRNAVLNNTSLQNAIKDATLASIVGEGDITVNYNNATKQATISYNGSGGSGTTYTFGNGLEEENGNVGLTTEIKNKIDNSVLTAELTEEVTNAVNDPTNTELQTALSNSVSNNTGSYFMYEKYGAVTLNFTSNEVDIGNIVKNQLANERIEGNALINDALIVEDPVNAGEFIFKLDPTTTYAYPLLVQLDFYFATYTGRDTKYFELLLKRPNNTVLRVFRLIAPVQSGSNPIQVTAFFDARVFSGGTDPFQTDGFKLSVRETGFGSIGLDETVLNEGVNFKMFIERK